MPRRRAFRRRGGFRRARGFVRRTVRNMGRIEPKRVILTDFAPGANATPYTTVTTCGLVVCQESVNEETESNGTTIAEVPLYSRIVAIKLKLAWFNMGASRYMRWMLIKDPDNEGALTSLADADFHSSDDTPTARELRKNTLAKGWVIPSADGLMKNINIFIRKKTLRRLGSLREGDRIKLVLAANSATSVGQVSGFGTIYVRVPSG